MNVCQEPEGFKEATTWRLKRTAKYTIAMLFAGLMICLVALIVALGDQYRRGGYEGLADYVENVINSAKATGKNPVF